MDIKQIIEDAEKAGFVPVAKTNPIVIGTPNGISLLTLLTKFAELTLKRANCGAQSIEVDRDVFNNWFKHTFIDKRASQCDVAFEFYKRGRASLSANEQDVLNLLSAAKNIQSILHHPTIGVSILDSIKLDDAIEAIDQAIAKRKGVCDGTTRYY